MNEQELMLTAVLDCPRVDLYLERPPLSSAQHSRYRKMQERRANGEPLQYIIGDCDFLGLKLSVDDRVLIPRPETEILADVAIGKAQGLFYEGTLLKILDIGTGSGNIAIALAQQIPHCQVTALEISPQALAVAQENAQKHGVTRRIDFICQDMVGYLQQTPQREKFDIIISNPPYIPSSQLADLPRDVQQEPKIALDGGSDGLLFLRDIIGQSQRFLKEGGYLFLEIGDGQAEGIEKIFSRYPDYQEIQFHKDHRGTKRIVIASLRSYYGKVNH